MEQNNRINRAFTRQEIEQHLQSALAAATPDVWSKLDLTVPQERPKQDMTAARKQPDSDLTVPQKRSKLLYLNRRLRGAGMAAAACICLITAGGGYYHYEYLQVTSQVEIDVNPSLKLSLNRKERVLQAEALNADAAELVDISSLKGQTVDQAVDQVVDSLVEKGYLQKGETKHAVLVSVSGKNEEKARQLKDFVAANVEQTLSEKEVQAVVYDQVIQVTKELEELAEVYQVSAGKAEFVGQLVHENQALNQEQQDAYSRMIGQTMEELTQEIDDNAYQISSNVTIIRTEPVQSRESYADRRERRQLADGELPSEAKDHVSQKEEEAVKAPEDPNKASQEQESRSEAAREQEIQSEAVKEQESRSEAAKEQETQSEAVREQETQSEAVKEQETQSEVIQDHDEPGGGTQPDSSEKAGGMTDKESGGPADEEDFNAPESQEPLETETILAGSEMPAEDGAAAALADAGPETPDQEPEADAFTGGEVIASALIPLEGAADQEPQPPEENLEEEPAEGETAETEELAEGETAEAGEPAEGETAEAEEPVDRETAEAGEPAEGETAEAGDPVDRETAGAGEPAEGETAGAGAPVDRETAEAEKPTEAAGDLDLTGKEKDPQPESGEPADNGKEPDSTLEQSDPEQDVVSSDPAEGTFAPADRIHPAGPKAPEPPAGPGELADFEDEEESSRIIHSPSDRLDTFEPGDVGSRKETGSMITSSGNQIIFEDVEKKEWKEPVYASEFLTGSERRFLQKGPGVFSGNISEEDQETILRFGPGFAAYSEKGRESIMAENDVFLSHGFLGLRRKIIKIKK